MHMPTKRCSTYLAKGGTGKSTSTAHIGAALVEQDHDVLLLDLAGKQDDLATIFGIHDSVQADVANDDAYPNIATTMEEDWSQLVDILGGPEAALDELVYETSEGVDLIPAHESLDTMDADLGNVDNAQERYSRLRRFLDKTVEPTDRYDVVLLDLPGAPNNLTYNGIWATRDVLTPVLPGELEVKQARGLRDDLVMIREEYDIDARLAMLILNQYQRGRNLSKRKHQELEEEFGDLLAPEWVVSSEQVAQATEEGHTLFAIDEDELTSTGADAKAAFSENAEALYERLR
ncbi:hypothetical protein GCM10009066_02020 [Halarchaeum salinum]|uniref:AAA domain-containing protein n=2 Tax=Halarchaeum salinum TaxID=489912 RepID=A0AAV3S4M4_9EURY